MSVNAPPPPPDNASASPEGQPPEGQPPANGTPKPPPTVEEVEAQWQHRVSQKDRAHAAAEQALRDENDGLRRQLAALSAPRPQSNGQSGTPDNSAETEALRQQLEEQRRATAEAERLRQLDQRRAKYPALSSNVGEAGIDIFAVQDEATLARLNAQLEDGSPTGTFAPTAPRRPAPVAGKSLADMNKQELEDQMRQTIERGALKAR